MTHDEFADELSQLIAKAYVQLGGSVVLEILEEQAEYLSQLIEMADD